jgi:Cu/Ag efflux protein CusF
MKIVSALILLAILCGCSKAPAPPKEYVLKGEILKLDPSGQLVTVKGEKTEGWMEAMTMDYPVRDKQVFDKLKVGETVSAQVMVQGTQYWLSAVTETSADSSDPPPPSK